MPDGASIRALGARTSRAGRRQNRTELGDRRKEPCDFPTLEKTKGRRIAQAFVESGAPGEIRTPDPPVRRKTEC